MHDLSLTATALSLVPLAIGLVVFSYFQLRTTELAIAGARMVLQLVAIGYLLSFIFRYDWPLLGIAIMFIMVYAATAIASRPLKRKSRRLFFTSLAALSISGIFNLSWMIAAVLALSPWYQPAIVIPLAGMVFSSGMNALSIGAERLEKEIQSMPLDTIQDPQQCHRALKQTALPAAMNAAMIPQVNALFAVGLVSLPGMMTGQILSGVSPLIAVRYQIMVMSMMLGTSAIALALYFLFSAKQYAHMLAPTATHGKTD